MPWVRVTGRVIDTSTYRAHADAHTNTPRPCSANEPRAQPETLSDGAMTTPQRISHSTAPGAGASPCTANMPLREQFRSTSDEGQDGVEGDEDDEREEWRTRMIFRDLLCEFYPRYGVSLKEEFGKSFKAARTEETFSAFPEPGVFGIMLR